MSPTPTLNIYLFEGPIYLIKTYAVTLTHTKINCLRIAIIITNLDQ
jgi:hypothetical protein